MRQRSQTFMMRCNFTFSKSPIKHGSWRGLKSQICDSVTETISINISPQSFESEIINLKVFKLHFFFNVERPCEIDRILHEKNNTCFVFLNILRVFPAFLFFCLRGRGQQRGTVLWGGPGPGGLQPGPEHQTEQEDHQPDHQGQEEADTAHSAVVGPNTSVNIQRCSSASFYSSSQWWIPSISVFLALHLSSTAWLFSSRQAGGELYCVWRSVSASVYPLRSLPGLLQERETRAGLCCYLWKGVCVAMVRQKMS